jgi:hypothetical protein
MAEKDPVTQKQFDEFKNRTVQLLTAIYQALRPLLTKAYPQIKSPESGDTLARGAGAARDVQVKSNKPTTSSGGLVHWVEFRREDMTTITGLVRVQVDFSMNPPTAKNVRLPDESTEPVDYVIVCYVGADDPANPGAAQHHIDKIGVTVTA